MCGLLRHGAEFCARKRTVCPGSRENLTGALDAAEGAGMTIDKVYGLLKFF